MSEVEKVIKKWPRDVLEALAVERFGDDDSTYWVRRWRIQYDHDAASNECNEINARMLKALARNELKSYDQLEALYQKTRRRADEAYAELRALDKMHERMRAEEEQQLAKEEAARADRLRPRPKRAPLCGTGMVLAERIVASMPPEAFDGEGYELEWVEEVPALPAPRAPLGLPAPRLGLPLRRP